MLTTLALVLGAIGAIFAAIQVTWMVWQHLYRHIHHEEIAHRVAKKLESRMDRNK